MKLSIALAAAFAGSAAAVYAPPQPKDGQDLMSLWKQVEAEAVFMQNEIALKRSLAECEEDCNLAKEEADKKDEDFNRGRCQKNCKQLDDDGALSNDDGSGNRDNRSGSDQDDACDACCDFPEDGNRQERCLIGADCDDDWCTSGGNRNKSSRRGSEMFYKGMCGSDTDDDLTYVDDFCEDMFGNSGENICRNPSDKECKNFCKWLDSSSKSFSNRDYSMGMCDDPSDDDDGSEKKFCDDIDDDLCGLNENRLTRRQIDLCDWLYDDLSTKKADAAASLFKFAPMLRAAGAK